MQGSRPAASVQYSPDGLTLAVATLDGCVCLMDARSHQTRGLLHGAGTIAPLVAFLAARQQWCTVLHTNLQVTRPGNMTSHIALYTLAAVLGVHTEPCLELSMKNAYPIGVHHAADFGLKWACSHAHDAALSRWLPGNLRHQSVM